jgi:hypothetical protein
MASDLKSCTRPEAALRWMNGVDARAGGYLEEPASVRHFAALARGVRLDRGGARALRAARDAGKARRGLKEGLDPRKLADAGWGVVFPRSADAAGSDSVAVREALAPLLALRQAQATVRKERNFRVFAGEDGYRDGESKIELLARHGAGPGPVDPEKVPFYLLLVGGPEEIPFAVQYQLEIQYAVGRLCFDRPEEYRSYAESVVAAEAGGCPRRRGAAFFAPSNPGDPVTQASPHLLRPLAAAARATAGWDVEPVLGAAATRGKLGRLFAGEAPAFLFAACHGLGFPAGDPQQRAEQGALVCQEWPGPAGRRIDRDHYFAAEDLAGDAGAAGLIAFCYSCFGAGTPRFDDYARAGQGERRSLTPAAFLGRLPQRLLAHPKGGALAVIGHVERAWGFSVAWPEAGPQTVTFESAVRRLLGGQPVGLAMEVFHQRYAELASDLAAEVEALGFGKKPDDTMLADLWIASRDARNYTILGDPAVRLAVGADSTPEGGLP